MRDDETQTERNARRVDELRAAGFHSTLGIGLGPSESTAAGDNRQPGGDTSPPGTDPAGRTTTTGGTMIRKGQVFDTPFERGCVALEAPNSHGSFLALDSDGVRADFHVAMVENVRDAAATDLAGEVADALTPRALRPADEDRAGGRNTLTRFADPDEA